MVGMKRSPGVSSTDPGQRPAPAAAFDALTADELPRLILDSADLGEFLEAFAMLAARHFAAAGNEVGCGITIVPGRRPASTGFSDHRARLLGQLQLTAWGTPSLPGAQFPSASLRAGVHAADLGPGFPWSEYADLARRHGAAAVAYASFDLFPDVGSGLLLHSTRAGDFDGPVLRSIGDFARRAEPSLRLAVRFYGLADTAHDLRAALESRTVIDQALGIIMGQNRCSQHEAFTMLRSASSRRNLKLRDLAANIVATVGGSVAETHFSP
jgi:hypothetical protein